METLCHLLGVSKDASACCIHAQFLVTDRVKAPVGIFLTGGKCCAYIFFWTTGPLRGRKNIYAQHEQVSIGMVGK